MISVITITYNRAKLLEQAISSVLAQDFKDFEYIIIDDGSMDETKQVIEKFSNDKIRYFHYEHCGRLSVLRNRGLHSAKGEMIAFLDSDDSWEPGYLSTITRLLQPPQVKAVISNCKIRAQDNTRVLMGENFRADPEDSLLHRKFSDDSFVIYPSAFSFKKLSGLTFNEGMRHGDNDLFLRMLALSGTSINPEPLVNIRKHDDNMSAKPDLESSFIQAYFEEFQSLDHLLKEKKISASFYRKIYAKYAYKLANNLSSLGMKKEAKEYYIKSLKMSFTFKSLVRTLLS
jgi:glycosyltransferase involved in cell wall biosynthesis